VASQEQYFVETLNKSIIEHRRRKDLTRRVFWTIQITVMLLGAASTVLLGLNTGNPHYTIVSRNLVLCFSALSALLTGLAAFWNLETYWLKRKVVLNRLVALKQELEFSRVRADPLSGPELRDYFIRYLDTLNLQAEYWDSLLVQSPDPTVHKPPVG
jgi:hypothetical protein